MWSMTIIDALNLVMTISSIIFFSIQKKYVRDVDYFCEKNMFTQDEFSLKLSGLPVYLYPEG